MSRTKISVSLASVLLTLFLCLGFKTESLWTDEAFSAFIACHRSFVSLWQTLLAGDSSDLQMWLYYTYLHFWVSWFGSRELALRSANIPFILIYSLAIVWTRNQLFRSSWVWVAALSPFVWAYAADARPYLCIVSLSTVFVLCLLAWLTDPRFATSRTLPWIALISLLVGMNLHMLMILVVPPALVLLLTYRFANRSSVPVSLWLQPMLFLSPLFVAYFIFLAWTFSRGTSYDYAHPDLLSMGSVLFRFVGLAGFAPNRHYAVSFRPYVAGMMLAAIGILAAAFFALRPAWRARHSRTICLAAALTVGICEALTLSFVFKQQIEVRHLACLFAFFLLLLFSVWEFALEINAPKPAFFISLSLVALIWLISDFRMTFLPEYRRENFRDAIAETIAASSANTEIAVVADPAAAAYYGLGMKGENPCFPLSGKCEDALAQVPWQQLRAASQATFWSSQRIQAWLDEGEQVHRDRVLLISRSRHPMYSDSAWWLALRKTKSDSLMPFFGFFVYTLDGKSTKRPALRTAAALWY